MKRNLTSHPEAASAAPGESRRMAHRPENPGHPGPARPVRMEFTEVSFSVNITQSSVKSAHGGSWRPA